MIKRFLITVVGVLVLAIASTAQDRLTFASSIDLPAQLSGKLASASSRVGCGEDGSMTIFVYEGEESSPRIVRLSPNGNILASIDVQHLLKIRASDSCDFAPGPDGETYVLLESGYPWTEESEENGQRKVVFHGTRNPSTEVLRFSSTGELLSRIQLQPRLRFSKLAVFSGGTILVVGRENPQEHNPGFLVAMLYKPNGTFLREVDLPVELSLSEPDHTWEWPLVPTPMAVPKTDEVWLVRTGRSPMLTAIPERGEVLFTARLKAPDGFRIIKPRSNAGRLFAALMPMDRKVEKRYLYAQFDPSSGVVTQVAASPRPEWNAICETSNGMTFIDNTKNTLNVMVLAPPADDSTSR